VFGKKWCVGNTQVDTVLIWVINTLTSDRFVKKKEKIISKKIYQQVIDKDVFGRLALSA